jgi:hypothetical protein
MTEETSFKKLKEWISNHTRLTITEIDSNILNAKEKLGNAYIDLTVSIADSGKYICTGYISLDGYGDTKADLVEVFKTVKSEEDLIKVLKKIILATNDLRDTVWRLEADLRDS